MSWFEQFMTRLGFERCNRCGKYKLDVLHDYLGNGVILTTCTNCAHKLHR